MKATSRGSRQRLSRSMGLFTLVRNRDASTRMPELGAKHACRVDGLVVKVSDPIQRPVHDVRMYHDIRYCRVRTAHSLDDINEVDDILDVVPMRDHVEPHARAIFGGQRGNELSFASGTKSPPSMLRGQKKHLALQ